MIIWFLSQLPWPACTFVDYGGRGDNRRFLSDTWIWTLYLWSGDRCDPGRRQFPAARVFAACASVLMTDVIPAVSSSGITSALMMNKTYSLPQVFHSAIPNHLVSLLNTHRTSQLNNLLVVNQGNSQPNGQPSEHPSGQPTGQPPGQPTGQPPRQPSGQPSGQLSGQHTGHPSDPPTGQPNGQPSGQPTGQPTGQSTGQLSGQHTGQPSDQPTNSPMLSLLVIHHVNQLVSHLVNQVDNQVDSQLDNQVDSHLVMLLDNQLVNRVFWTLYLWNGDRCDPGRREFPAARVFAACASVLMTDVIPAATSSEITSGTHDEQNLRRFPQVFHLPYPTTVDSHQDSKVVNRPDNLLDNLLDCHLSAVNLLAAIWSATR